MSVPQNQNQNQNQNLPANQADYNPYLAYGQQAVQSRIVGKLLKFSKFGEFTAGEDNEPIPLGTRLVVHVPEILVGWQRWWDGKPTDQVMGRLCDNFQPPRRSELGDTDETEWEIDNEGNSRDPWQFSNLVIMKAADDTQLYTFATASRGGKQAVGKVCIAFGHAMRHKPDMLPVVELGRSSYDHPNKQFGEIRVPTFEVVDWAPRASFDAALDPGAAEAELPIEEPPPKKTLPPQQKPAATKPMKATDRGTRF